MKILYLYAELMGYTMATIRALAESGNEIIVVHWDHKKLTPYNVPSLKNVRLYGRSQLTVSQMIDLVTSTAPSITVISGWMDRGYMKVAKHLRKLGVPVVAGFDSQWSGSRNQRLAEVLSWIGYFSKFYSHAWVAGAPQFEFARRLGFERRNIVFDLYSADLHLFDAVYADSNLDKKEHYPHRFLYVGRYEPVKGLDVLMKAWEFLGRDRSDWQLHLVGSGSLRADFENSIGVVCKDFMQPTDLADEVSNAGCFVLPSRKEPWGVVVHEFAAAGLPLVLSDVVGAGSTFLISGFNGFNFNSNDAVSLANRMRQIIRMTDEQLHAMAVNSHALSKRVTPETSATNLLSIISP